MEKKQVAEDILYEAQLRVFNYYFSRFHASDFPVAVAVLDHAAEYVRAQKETVDEGHQ